MLFYIFVFSVLYFKNHWRKKLYVDSIFFFAFQRNFIVEIVIFVLKQEIFHVHMKPDSI